jgi:hypothetical protein
MTDKEYFDRLAELVDVALRARFGDDDGGYEKYIVWEAEHGGVAKADDQVIPVALLIQHGCYGETVASLRRYDGRGMGISCTDEGQRFFLVPGCWAEYRTGSVINGVADLVRRLK